MILITNSGIPFLWEGIPHGNDVIKGVIGKSKLDFLPSVPSRLPIFFVFNALNMSK